jgi:hypothetical protein
MSEQRRPEDTCVMCGGDGRIANSFGSVTTCPSCHGSGRRLEDAGFHDVTKTKPSHHKGANQAAAAAKPQWPTTHEGGRLATEVQACASCTDAEKARLVREIMDHEGTHGTLTQTFIKKVKKQIRPPAK